jgi:DNA invertase Pin-like site-specific DNA recombinase
MEAKVDFVAVDNPQANKLMFHMLAAFAEHESDLIRTRIKEALEAAKRRGVRLGTHGKPLAKTNRKQAKAFTLSLQPILENLHHQGIISLRSQAEALNQARIPTFRGGQWHKTSVYRVAQRLRGKG